MIAKMYLPIIWTTQTHGRVFYYAQCRLKFMSQPSQASPWFLPLNLAYLSWSKARRSLANGIWSVPSLDGLIVRNAFSIWFCNAAVAASARSKASLASNIVAQPILTSPVHFAESCLHWAAVLRTAVLDSDGSDSGSDFSLASSANWAAGDPWRVFKFCPRVSARSWSENRNEISIHTCLGLIHDIFMVRNLLFAWHQCCNMKYEIFTSESCIDSMKPTFVLNPIRFFLHWFSVGYNRFFLACYQQDGSQSANRMQSLSLSPAAFASDPPGEDSEDIVGGSLSVCVLDFNCSSQAQHTLNFWWWGHLFIRWTIYNCAAELDAHYFAREYTTIQF